MLPTFILEPGPTQKQHAYARSLAWPRTSPFPDLDDFRSNLKDLRRAAATDLDLLSETLIETLRNQANVEVFTADDVQQVVEAIQQICGTSLTIAINQSSVLTQEIIPELRQLGFRTIESYSGEFSLSEDRFTDYHQLPRGTAGHLVDSFSTSNLSRRRGGSIETNGVKDFTALLGVNAISADNGTAFFMQHFRNISRVFEQARQIILLVALDKIVPKQEEARLQALGMGVFGWETKLLRLGSKGGESELDALSFIPSTQRHDDLAVIVMDNGRRQLQNGYYHDLLTCIGCRACIRSCPTQQFFGGHAGWSPKEYLYYFVQGKSSSLDLCLNCGMCRIECPLDIDLPGMIVQARYDRTVRRMLTDAILSNFEMMGWWGSHSPALVNLALRHPLSRLIADKILGISKDAPMPGFHRDTLARWLKSRGGRR
jgi:L-lactate dehydrogenase complex protein LldG